MRLASNFRSHTSLKVLYYTVVGPVLEYGSVIWDSQTVGDSFQLELVQRRFFKFTGFILGIMH